MTEVWILGNRDIDRAWISETRFGQLSPIQLHRLKSNSKEYLFTQMTKRHRNIVFIHTTSTHSEFISSIHFYVAKMNTIIRLTKMRASSICHPKFIYNLTHSTSLLQFLLPCSVHIRWNIKYPDLWLWLAPCQKFMAVYQRWHQVPAVY